MLMNAKSNFITKVATGCLVMLGGLLSASTASAQLTLTLGQASNAACDASEVVVPLVVSGVTTNLTSFGVRVVYDTTKADFLGSTKGSGVADWGLVNSNEATAGTVIVGGSAFAGTPVSGDAQLINLRFTAVQAACPSIVALTLESPSANTASAALVNGQLAFGEFPTIRIPDVSGACGTSIAVPVLADNVASNITSFGVRIAYDTTKLDFTGVVKGADTTDWGLVNGNEPSAGTIILGGSAFAGTPISGDVELIVVNFTFLQAPLTDEPLTLNSPSANTASFQLDSGTVSCIDNQAPVAACVTSLTVNLSAGVVDAVDLDSGSTDPDADPLTFLVNGNASYPLSCVDVANSPITLTLNVSDGSLSDDCTVAVTVVDDIDPTAVAQNVTLTLDGAGQATLDAADIDGGSSDNCGSIGLSASQTAFDCGDTGVNTVTLTVTDDAGNTATATASVTVVDNTAPNAAASNITIQLNAAGQASITAAQVDNGSSDNCGTPTLSLSKTNFSCADLGANVVTLTARDASNNTDTAQATVTVVDQIAPNAVAKNISIALDVYGNASIVAADVNDGSTDNCGTPTVSIDVDTFDCTNLGPNNVVLSATDSSNNVDATPATAVVTVIDDLAPTLDVVANAITLVLDATGSATLAALDTYEAATDNCSVEASSLSVSQSTFTCADLGDNTVTVTIADTSGNTATGTVTVTVVDTTAPTAIAQDITVELGADGTASITAADVDNGSSDNCTVSLSIDVTDFTCANLGANTVTLTATDQGNLSATATATVTVVDSLDPVIDAEATTTVNLGGVPGSGVGSATIEAEDLFFSVTDNCGVASTTIDVTSFDCTNLSAPVDVTITATDTSGNIETFVVSVTVTDTTDVCTIEEGEGEGVVEEECRDDDDNGIYDNPSVCLDPEVVFGLTNVGVAGGCLLETRQILFTNNDGTGDVTLSVPDPNNFEVTVDVTIPRSSIPTGESAVFVVKVSCDLANLVSGDDSAADLQNHLGRDNVPVEEIIPGTYVLATVFQELGEEFVEVPGVNATINFQGLEVNTVEEPAVYQHGTTVEAGTVGPRANGDAAGSWNEADSALEGTDVVVNTNGLSVFVVTQPAPQVPFLSVTPNSNYARIVGVVQTGSSRTIEFALKNTGPGVVTGAATVTGTGYSIDGTANYTLVGTTTATVKVKFAPATEGTQAGSVTFTGGTNGPVTINLWGTGANVVKTAFFGCGSSDGAGMGMGDMLLLAALLTGLLAASRFWTRARQN